METKKDYSITKIRRMALYRGLARELKIHEVVNSCCAFATCTSAVRRFFLTPPPKKNSIAFF